jgi:hypothetical protein
MARSPLRPGHRHPTRPTRQPAGNRWPSHHPRAADRPAHRPHRTFRSRGRQPQNPARGQGPGVGQGLAPTHGRTRGTAGGPPRSGAPVPLRPPPTRRAPTPVCRTSATRHRCRCAERPRPRRPAGTGRRPANAAPWLRRRTDTHAAGPGAGGRSRPRPRQSQLGAPASGGGRLGRFRTVALAPPHRSPGRSPNRAPGPRAPRRRPIGLQPGLRTSPHPTRGSPTAPLPAARLANPTPRVPNGTRRAQVAPHATPDPTRRGQIRPTRRGQANTGSRGQIGIGSGSPARARSRRDPADSAQSRPAIASRSCVDRLTTGNRDPSNRRTAGPARCPARPGQSCRAPAASSLAPHRSRRPLACGTRQGAAPQATPRRRGATTATARARRPRPPPNAPAQGPATARPRGRRRPHQGRRGRSSCGARGLREQARRPRGRGRRPEGRGAGQASSPGSPNRRRTRRGTDGFLPGAAHPCSGAGGPDLATPDPRRGADGARGACGTPGRCAGGACRGAA